MIPNQTDDFERVTVKVLPDGRVSRRDAAKYLGRTTKTLAAWACEERGPRPIKAGGRCFYWLSDLQAFARGDAQGAA